MAVSVTAVFGLRRAEILCLTADQWKHAFQVIQLLHRQKLFQGSADT